MAKKPTLPTTEKPTVPADPATRAEPLAQTSGAADVKPEASARVSAGAGEQATSRSGLPKAEVAAEKRPEEKSATQSSPVKASGTPPAQSVVQTESGLPKSEPTKPESPKPERPTAERLAAPGARAPTASRPAKDSEDASREGEASPLGVTAQASGPASPVSEQGVNPEKPVLRTPGPKSGASPETSLPHPRSAGATRGQATDSEPRRPAVVPVMEPARPPVVEPMARTLPEAPAERPRAPEAEPPATPTPEPAREQARPPVAEPEPSAPPESAPGPFQHYEQRPSLYVVHVTPEMAPVAKVGGLADVVFGLSRELAIRGNHVEIILPKYDNLRYDHIFQMHPVYEDLWVPWYEGAIHCTVYFSFVHDRKCFFIEPHSQDNFFNRGSLYGFKDDVLRFAFFSRAAMEFMWKAGKHPDVIHCHDWQTALVPVFLYEVYQPLGMHHPRVCLTIHNFLHQGVTGVELLRATGLHRPERFMAYERLGDNNHRGALNLLKGGIVYSNFIATVSPRYAFETKDSGQGFGLEPTLHTHHMKYGGVVNGVDYDVWNPEIDNHIPVRYGVDSIDGKYDNKRALRHRFMLAESEKPIVAFIGRLDPQKGLELVRHAIFYALEKGAQFVLLGSSPDPRINADFWGLKHMLNDSPDCHLELGFDEDLSHLIYAGADMMLVPSQFEPCGLTQLIALRYGTIPVVRSVGGLADTVFDKDHSLRPLHERNGYSFETYDAQGLESALGRAIACYYNHPDHFRELMKNAMRSDNSWNHPGQDYLNIYDFIRHR